MDLASFPREPIKYVVPHCGMRVHLLVQVLALARACQLNCMLSIPVHMCPPLVGYHSLSYTVRKLFIPIDSTFIFLVLYTLFLLTSCFVVVVSCMRNLPLCDCSRFQCGPSLVPWIMLSMLWMWPLKCLSTMRSSSTSLTHFLNKVCIQVVYTRCVC